MPQPDSAIRPSWLTGCVVAILVLGAAVSVRPLYFAGEKAHLRAAALALTDGRYADAERLALKYAASRRDASHAWLIAAEAAAKLHLNDRALRHLSHIAEDRSDYGVRSQYAKANLLLKSGRASDAEHLLRRVLENSPHHLDAAVDLVYLLQVEGRSWEALPYLQLLIRSGRMSGDHLRLACSTEANWLREIHFVEKCRSAVPDDPLPLLGRARELLRDNEHEAAKKLLEEIVLHHPSNAEAQARLGRLLLNGQDESAFVAWHKSLPPDTPEHPDLWLNLGIWAARHEQKSEAIRCLWEAVQLHPYHGLACNELSRALSAQGEREAAAWFADRARRLSKVDYLLSDVGEDAESYLRLAQALEGLGRDWEAAGWYDAAWHFRDQPSWAGPQLKQVATRLQNEARQSAAGEAKVVGGFDFSHLPLPHFGAPVAASGDKDDSVGQFGQPTFANVAQEVGLEFQYFNGQDPTAGRAYMFEFQGGGAAVLDYDNDGWPDLYLTQGCRWPYRADDFHYRDRLFRNLGTGKFQDVTDDAGIVENGLSSGVTIGDIDNDGWPDIYVCNIGANRLYRNNGDGTFSDITQSSGTAGEQWSSGAAFGDFNQDGLPDLYVVNYLAGPDVYERACEDEGHPVQCGPTLFEAEQDRLYLNSGDGRFQDVTEVSGIVAADGKGLGIVVGDLCGSAHLDVFVANDTTANFLFRNEGTGAGKPPRFSEEALALGTAFDDEGNAQACMGIAAGDVNEDGRADLFITNFYRQPNALYVQGPSGIFTDRVRPAGLFDSSFLMLGWGTQFLDAELDGRSDLVLVNGHVNDFRHSGTPYHMRAQLHRKLGGDRFGEVSPETLGPYFSELHLGRALARLDWNRDGREDFVVTHIDAPVALLENRTSPRGNFLTLRLIGVTGARDAIGARVRVVAGGRTWHRQLTSGDGFQSSNQRTLTIGIGDLETVDSVHVRWPGALSEIEYTNVPVGAEITLIEGSSVPFLSQ